MNRGRSGEYLSDPSGPPTWPSMPTLRPTCENAGRGRWVGRLWESVTPIPAASATASEKRATVVAWTIAALHARISAVPQPGAHRPCRRPKRAWRGRSQTGGRGRTGRPRSRSRRPSARRGPPIGGPSRGGPRRVGPRGCSWCCGARNVPLLSRSRRSRSSGTARLRISAALKPGWSTSRQELRLPDRTCGMGGHATSPFRYACRSSTESRPPPPRRAARPARRPRPRPSTPTSSSCARYRRARPFPCSRTPRRPRSSARSSSSTPATACSPR